MPQVTFGKVNVRGQDYEVFIDRDGRFRTDCQGEHIYEATLDELKNKVMKLTEPAKVRVSIPFYAWTRDEGLRHGTVIGIHGSNDNLLVKWDGEGKTTQIHSWGAPEFLRLTEAEASQFTALQVSLQKLHDDIKAFSESHKFSPRLEIKQSKASAA